jgi:hypothetical protein
LIELLGPSGLAQIFYKMRQSIVKLQTGLIYHYAFIILIIVVLLVFFVRLERFWSNFFDSRLVFVSGFSILMGLTFTLQKVNEN